MLFYLDDSLIVDSKDAKFFEIKKSVRNLALCVVESKHLLTGSYIVIEHFEGVFRGNEDEVSILFHNMKRDFAICAIPSCLTYYIEVVNGEPKELQTNNGVTIGQVHYNFFVDTYSCQACALVGEDRRDTEFYKHIIDWYLSVYLGVNLKYSFDGIRGGGDNTEEEIIEQKRRKRVCLGIVDTDKKYPTDIVKSNSTCGKCRNITNSALCRVIVLNVQEVENIIPLNYINKLEWKDGAEINKMHFDELCYRAKSEYLLPFFDLKKGIRKKDIMGNLGYYNFAKECFLQNRYINKDFDFEGYLSTLNDDDYVYRPLKSALFKVVCEELLNKKNLKPELMEYQEVEWKNIGEAIMNFACARGKDAIH